MASLSTGNLLASLTLATVTAAGGDTTGTARLFLEAFATNPTASREMVTGDAMIVVGDIGGPFSEFLREVRPKARWLTTCRVASLEPRAAPSKAELAGGDTPEWLRGGAIAPVEGVYSCTGPSGSITHVRVVLVLKDGRVAQFSMAPME